MVSSNDSLKMEPWPRREMSLCSREHARTASFLVGAASASEWMTFNRSAARRSYERERVDLTVRRTDHIPLAHARSYDIFRLQIHSLAPAATRFSLVPGLIAPAQFSLANKKPLASAKGFNLNATFASFSVTSSRA